MKCHTRETWRRLKRPLQTLVSRCLFLHFLQLFTIAASVSRSCGSTRNHRHERKRHRTLQSHEQLQPPQGLRVHILNSTTPAPPPSHSTTSTPAAFTPGHTLLHYPGIPFGSPRCAIHAERLPAASAPRGGNQEQQHGQHFQQARRELAFDLDRSGTMSVRSHWKEHCTGLIATQFP